VCVCGRGWGGDGACDEACSGEGYNCHHLVYHIEYTLCKNDPLNAVVAPASNISVWDEDGEGENRIKRYPQKVVDFEKNVLCLSLWMKKLEF